MVTTPFSAPGGADAAITGAGAKPPAGWDASAHALWQGAARDAAIQTVLARINQGAPPKPLALVLQMAYYLFLIGDPAAAAHFLSAARSDHPQDVQLLLNLGVCLNRSGQYERALPVIQALIEQRPDDFNAWDALCNCEAKLGHLPQAAIAGSTSLAIKHQRSTQGAPLPSFVGSHPSSVLSRPGLSQVLAFSLWGNHPRYLRGAIDNALAASLYPGWTLRFYIDQTLPQAIADALRELGAQLIIESPGQPLRRKLAWRFQVACDPTVGRFLVRDVDSVINEREKRAVDEWVQSDRWFHVMRDWWTHTDLMLAGMWGGVSGALLDLMGELDRYQAGQMETPNIDQWFLRDKIWSQVHHSVLVHDRCFDSLHRQAWPGPQPQGMSHVGQDVFSSDGQAQALRLAHWIERLVELR